MNIRLLLCALIAFIISNSYSQVVVWSEDFGADAPPGCTSADTPAGGYVSGNGTWTVTATGANAAEGSEWYVSTMEEGKVSGQCSDGCGYLATNATNRTLHVSSSQGWLGDVGAAYEVGGFCGLVICVEANLRAESPTIDLTGQTGALTLQFDYLHGGQANIDYCELMYFDGVSWTNLLGGVTSLPLTGVGPCNPQAQWGNYSIALPASANNNPNVKIGFNWHNNDDGVGVDPSFAVDNVEITTPATSAPVADFSTTNTTICVGDCIDFTDASTLGTNPTWAWTFTGAATTSSSAQNPTGICYNTAGTYTVELTVTDDNGNDTETKTNYITVTAAGNAGADNSGNVCNDNTLDLNTLLSGADAGGTWVETSGSPSGQFTAGTGVLDGNGLTNGNVYTFTYTVGGVGCSDVATITVTVVDCSVLTTAFTPSATSICIGDCVTFADNSTGPITGWSWTFNNGTPGTANTQNPGSVCYTTAGTFDVTLQITDGTNTDQTTVQITVNDLPSVTATASPSDTVCVGDQVTLTGAGAATYTWDNGVTDAVAFVPAATTTYNVMGTDANGCQRGATVTIVVESCDTLSADFSLPNYDICLGTCVQVSNNSTGTISTYSWDFGGGGTPNTSTVSEPNICFMTIGTFTVTLTITDAGGASSTATQTVNVYNAPSVNAQLDTVITLGGQADLIALGSDPNATYLWTPNEFINCDTCSTTFASPWEDTDYLITITDVNGCTGNDTVKVLVNFVEAIGVPSAFSPNGDGENDVLYVKGTGITRLKFSVYNKYGQKVFEADNQNIGWDGTFHGKEENAGVFAWMVEYTLVNGTAGVLKGNTTLIR
ncbi:MAG: PKD domain-containing protein [Crocinitomicaceae bacterium]|nr:PKD domain-containing protein [Crocinitomicaceae bacterium]